jgi:hypothetical protein
MSAEFQAQIESDFTRFDGLIRKESQRDSMSFGWSKEFQHSELGPARAFVVVVGWKNMDLFQQLVQSEECREAVKILYAWGAPFQMVRFEVVESRDETNFESITSKRWVDLAGRVDVIGCEGDRRLNLGVKVRK